MADRISTNTVPEELEAIDRMTSFLLGAVFEHDWVTALQLAASLRLMVVEEKLESLGEDAPQRQVVPIMEELARLSRLIKKDYGGA